MIPVTEPEIKPRSLKCEECKRDYEVSFWVRKRRHCFDCRHAYFETQLKCWGALKKARLDGKIDSPTNHLCVDCGKPAYCWDHRDYMKPLDVEPVCRSCNAKRPPSKWKAA